MTAPIADKIKFTVGHPVEVQFEPINRRNWDGRERMYWRRGVRPEVKEWLDENIGERCRSNADWDHSDIGAWAYLGARIRSIANGGGETVILRFRSADHALLFKLAWFGKL